MCGGAGLCMHEFLPLAAVGSADIAATRPVGRRAGQDIDGAQFRVRIDAWQAAFAAAPGRRWALLIDDAIEFAAALYGAWHAGKQVFLPADAQPGTLDRLTALVDGRAGEWPGALQALAEAPAQPRQALDLQTTSLVLFTSGSGGEPVAIAKSLAQLQAEIDAQQALHGRHWSAAPGLCVWATVAHQHIYGLLFAVLWPLASGSRMATPRLAYAEQMALQLGPEPALLVSSPAHLKRLPDGLDWSRARTALRAVLSSGGPLPPEAALRAAQCFGEAPIEIYGSSETGGVAWRQRRRHGEHWNALPMVEWRIEAEQGGLLAVRSPFLPDAQWFTTADRVQAESDGSFTLLGRADRIVKIEERRVSLTAIEQRLAASPLVAEVRALALTHGRGQRVAAALVPSAAGAALLQDGGRPALIAPLRQALHAHIERIAWPRHWRFVDSLPANSQGKVTEAAVAALFAQPPAWHWLARSAGAARAERVAEAGLAAFEGHFPGAAILPGVVQLAWVVEAGREAFALAAPVRRIEALKFQQVVRPGARLTLTLQWEAASRRLHFRYESKAGVHGSGRLVYAAEAAERV